MGVFCSHTLTCLGGATFLNRFSLHTVFRDLYDSRKPQHTEPREINHLINRDLDNGAMFGQGSSIYDVRGLRKTDLTSVGKREFFWEQRCVTKASGRRCTENAMSRGYNSFLKSYSNRTDEI